MDIWPRIIQGGMGVGVSNWRLARAVSTAGQLGTVSLVAIPHVAARRLMQGDADMSRALDAFPVREAAEKIRRKYWRRETAPIPMFSLRPSRDLSWLTIFSGFAEVWLAKEGHAGKIAGNLLEKVQLPMLPTMLGALWARIDAFIIGAGLPTQIPDVLDALCSGHRATYRLNVIGAEGSTYETVLDMETLLSKMSPEAETAVADITPSRPAFFPIVSLDATAGILWKKMRARCDGFIVEHPVVAGGHNPAPRGWKGDVSDLGEPVYTDRDVADIVRMREFGVPFWLAGGYADPRRLEETLALGGAGIQCGTIFALCEESGISPRLRRELRKRAYRGELRVLSDPRASPTDFPFQVADMPGTVSEDAVYRNRERICDLGYLRVPYRTVDGALGYRCPAEPVGDYLKKGGKLGDTEGRKCLCNNLLAAVGLGMTHDGVPEPAIITLGKDTGFIRHLLADEDGSYAASDAIRYLLGSGGE